MAKMMKAAVVRAFGEPLAIRAHLHEARLDEINPVLSELRAGKTDGRVVLRLA